ncbi:MAG: hypothetical protein K0Q85_25 [Caproiciproducens sp.]|nr:hypothetical protein [Caproiciproducens sp.]
MSVKDAMAEDMAIFLNEEEFAEEIEYNGEKIMAIPDIGRSNEKGNTFTSDGATDRACFEISADDVLNPQTGDQIMYKGKEWTVIRMIATDGYMTTVECTANESAVMLR